MSRARRAGRIARGAAYGGGTLGLTGAALASLLVGEAKRARRTVGTPAETAPSADGLYDGAGEPITIAVLGDSSAAGLGVLTGTQTPGSVIAARLAEQTGRPVQLRTLAVVGARSADLAGQRARLEQTPDVTLLLIGANDVTHLVRPSDAVRELSTVVGDLSDAGSHVVVGTCPDLGTISPIGQPLRHLARRWSRMLAAAQTVGVVEAGGRSVSLGDLLGHEFEADPSLMFSADRFHPSASGYARVADVMLPSVLAALGLGDQRRTFEAGEGVECLPDAAARAAQQPGAEVSGTQLDGRDRGPRGRWAVLRHRLRITVPAQRSRTHA